jgi:hypothetical protein
VIGLVDRVLAVVAMLVAIRPLMRGALGSRSHLSWKRCVVLLAGGCGALLGVVGLLVVRAHLLGDPQFLPTALGATLVFFGGMLGVSTLMAGRGPTGLSEDAAIRYVTQAGAMFLYLAAPAVTLGLLGLTRLLRATAPWTVAPSQRWAPILEGVLLLVLVAVPRDETVGGLRFVADIRVGSLGSFGVRPG